MPMTSLVRSAIFGTACGGLYAFTAFLFFNEGKERLLIPAVLAACIAACVAFLHHDATWFERHLNELGRVYAKGSPEFNALQARAIRVWQERRLGAHQDLNLRSPSVLCAAAIMVCGGAFLSVVIPNPPAPATAGVAAMIAVGSGCLFGALVQGAVKGKITTRYIAVVGASGGFFAMVILFYLLYGSNLVAGPSEPPQTDNVGTGALPAR